MKPSNEPIFWALFGAGGMLCALAGAMLIFITGIAVPTGLFLPADAMSYAHVHAFAQHWFGKLAILAVISLILWHAFHRICISMHHLGLPAGPAVHAVTRGVALIATLATAYWLVIIGF